MRVAAGVWVGAVWLAAGVFQAGAEEGGLPIREVVIAGDSAVLAREGLLEEFRDSLEGRTLTPAAIQARARSLGERLRERGYRLASVRTPPADYATGVVPIDVDAGRFGKLTLTGPGGAPFEAQAHGVSPKNKE
jgi:hemolysin activation/secretion protein